MDDPPCIHDVGRNAPRSPHTVPYAAYDFDTLSTSGGSAKQHRRAVKLYLDGTAVGDGRVAATIPMLFSGDETTDVGTYSATPVSDDYGPSGSRFNGRIHWVQIDIAEAVEDSDHLITPEERYRVAMARQ